MKRYTKERVSASLTSTHTVERERASPRQQTKSVPVVGVVVGHGKSNNDFHINPGKSMPS